jgi:membrane protein implicated in regulation of membrane protease activity
MDNIGIAWIVVIVACIIIEGLTISLTTSWFAVGALVAFLLYSLGANLIVQFIVFFAVSIILLVFTRPIVTKYLKIGRVKTNVEGLIGERAKVISKINNLNNEGAVKVRGQIWSARTVYDNEEIETDTVVFIKNVVGVKLIVSKDEK